MPAHSKKGPVLSEVEGFTLVELLVVISIIAILAVIGITVFSNVQKGARDARRGGDLHAISLALEQYKAANTRYPDHNIYGNGGDGWDVSATYTGGQAEWAVLETLLAPYFSGGKLPIDPLNNNISPATGSGGGYMFYDRDVPGGGASGDGYTLVAYAMESSNNPGCGFSFYDTNYPGKYICIRNQQ